MAGLHQSSSLALPKDLWLLVFIHLSPEDLISLRETCKNFSVITRARWLWRNVIEASVSGHGLPLPAYIADLRTATLAELQHGAVRAAKFARIWSSQTGITPVRKLTFDTAAVADVVRWSRFADMLPVAQSCVLRIECLPSDALLTVHASQSIAVWRVPRGEDEARHIDAHALPPGQPFAGIVVDRTPGPTTRVCIASTTQNDVHLHFYSFDPLHARLMPLDTCALDMPANTLWAMKGDLVLYNDPPMVYDRTTHLVRFIIQPDPMFVQATPVIAAQFLHDDLVLVVQRQAILVMRIAPAGVEDFIGPVPFHVETEYQIEASIALSPTYHVPLPPTSAADLLPPAAVVVGISPHFIETTPIFFHARAHDAHWSVGERAARIAPTSATGVRVGPSGRGIWMETRAAPAAGPGRRAGETKPVRCVVGLDVPLLRAGAGAGTNSGPLFRAHEQALYTRPCGMGEIVARKFSIMTATIDDAAGRVVLGNRDGTVDVLDFT